MFEQHISSDILFHHDEKIISRNLYLCQPHKVIQLIEVASPPPRRISSVIHSSSAASSSYTSSLYISSSSSSFEQGQGEEEEEEEEEEESIHSSYCSSDVPMDELDVRLSPRTASLPDTLSGRMKRILLWREQSPQLTSDSISLKRRLEEIAEDVLDSDDNVSKRSRSSGSSSSVSSDRSIVSLELMHSCPACDAFFPTRQSLRQHGQDAQSNEACSVAVEYAFE